MLLRGRYDVVESFVLVVWWVVLMLWLEETALMTRIGHTLDPWFDRVVAKVDELTEGRAS